MIQKIAVSKALQPKTLEVKGPKSLMINEKIYKNEKPKLVYAAASGGVPPEDNNLKSFIKTPLSAEIIKKMAEKTKNINDITRKVFDKKKKKNKV